MAWVFLLPGTPSRENTGRGRAGPPDAQYCCNAPNEADLKLTVPLRHQLLWAAFITGAVVWFVVSHDPPVVSHGPYQGTIVGTYPPNRIRTGVVTVSVQLSNGETVLASVPMSSRYPYPNGTRVKVARLQSLIFHHSSYVAAPLENGADPSPDPN